MRGEWYTTDGHTARGGLVLAVIGAVILLGSGAAAAIATAVLVALIAAAALVVLTAAGLGAWLVYRARRDSTGIPSGRRIIPAPVVHQLPGPERPAIEPRCELHVHFHGVDPEQVAEILHRQE